MIARWHQCGTMTSQMLARASFSAVCLTVFPFEFRPRTFTIGFYGRNSIISDLMILECSSPLNLFCLKVLGKIGKMTPRLCSCAVVIKLERQKCQKKAPHFVEFDFSTNPNNSQRVARRSTRLSCCSARVGSGWSFLW